MAWTQPPELRGRHVRLVALAPEHAERLVPIIDLEHFKYFLAVRPFSADLEGAQTYVTLMLQERNVMPFVVEELTTGRLVGMSSYMDIREPHRALEIGMTWIAPEVRGTFVNPEMKYLMLRHAFEEFGAIRVQLKTDGRNLHSQAAIGKLGAKYEGTWRKHGIQPNGFVRDTVMFSILDDEWPDVKAGLETRLKIP